MLSPQGVGKEVGAELEAGRHVGKNKVKDGFLVSNRMSPANVIKATLLLDCFFARGLVLLLMDKSLDSKM